MPCFSQTVVDALHEAVKMHPLLAFHRQVFEKQVHQPGFSAPHAAPDIEASYGVGTASADPVQDRWPALLLQVVPQGVESPYDGLLMRIGDHAAIADERAVQVQRGVFVQRGLYGVCELRTASGNWLMTPFLSRPRKSIRRR